MNFTDDARERVPKASACYYAQLIQDNGFFSGATPPPATLALCGAAALLAWSGL